MLADCQVSLRDREAKCTVGLEMSDVLTVEVQIPVLAGGFGLRRSKIILDVAAGAE